MKLLHTADLHLGRKLDNIDLIEDQKYILDKILNIAIENSVDALLIAGDVYDKRKPSDVAIRLYEYFLLKCIQHNLPVYVIYGNHDSAYMLSFANDILKSSNIYCSPVFKNDISKYVLKKDDISINIFLMPYLEPSSIRFNLDLDKSLDRNQCFKALIERQNIDFNNEINVVLSHQFLSGASISDTEKNVGSLNNISKDVFKGFDYVAMGHLHRAQSLNKHIYYSGSPLKYSESELNHPKSLNLIDIKAKNNISVSAIALNPKREMISLNGTLDELLKKENYEKYPKDSFFIINLSDESYIENAYDRLHAYYENIISLKFLNNKFKTDDSYLEKLAEAEKMSSIDIMKLYYQLQTSGESLTLEQEDILLQIIDEVDNQDASN